MPRPHDLFFQLFQAKDESEVLEVIESHPGIFDDSNWKPLGQNESNYGVVKNQQASPIGALIEKLTNSIDAIMDSHKTWPKAQTSSFTVLPCRF